MTWILYATYPTIESGERAFGELLEVGVPPEDLVLVGPAARAGRAEITHARLMVDAGQTHPAELKPRQDHDERESPIGGGIATSHSSDDVSSPEEMDDAEEIAEDMAQPTAAANYADLDRAEALRFAARGTIDAAKPRRAGHVSRAPVPEFTAWLLGHLTVLGDGPLATELLALGTRRPDLGPLAALEASLYAAGVAADEAVRLADLVQAGSSLLAITEAPGRLPLHRLESLVEESGGAQSRSFLQREA